MSLKKNKLLQELSLNTKKIAKKDKSVVIRFTEDEYKSLSNTATSLNTSLPNMLREAILLTGLITNQKETSTNNKNTEAKEQ